MYGEDGDGMDGFGIGVSKREMGWFTARDMIDEKRIGGNECGRVRF